MRRLAVDGRNLWASIDGMDFGIGVVDTERTGSRACRRALRGVGFTAHGGEAWWATRGSCFAGQIVRRSAPSRARAGERSSSGGDGTTDHVFFAEWTSDGRPGDDMRAASCAHGPDGRRQRDLATGLGLPTQTALSGDHIYWVDRDRRHVARIGKNGGEVEVVVDDVAVFSVIASRGVAVFFAVATPVWNQVLTWDSTTGDIQVLAELGRDRGITPTEHGLLPSSSQADRLAFRPGRATTWSTSTRRPSRTGAAPIGAGAAGRTSVWSACAFRGSPRCEEILGGA
jgi:hypothetical protein